MLQDLHIHTTLCDGKNTPEEMVVSAIEKGVKKLGFSGHSYLSFDESYCMRKKDIPAYKEEINRLKEKYKDKIEILCGIEQDYFSEDVPQGYDYVIGSVHFVEVDGKPYEIDNTEEIFLKIVKEQFKGDFYSLAENYFDLVGKVAINTKADFIGHIDLITKFNEGYKHFDETHPRYVAAFRKAVDSIMPYCKVFEVNTGAISRGYRTEPYPSKQIAEYILKSGGKLILNSDAHSTDNICYQFDKWNHYLSL